MLIESQSLLLDGIIVFILSILFIQLIEKYAVVLKLVDIPNDRSSHTIPTPRGAGIAIFSAFFSVILLFHFSFFIQYISFFIAALLIFTLGVYDDLNNTSAKIKLIVIAIATVLIFLFNDFRIETLGNWFGYDLKLPYILSFVFTIFAVAGFTNALNLIDGLDGLAGTVSVIILAALFYIGFIYNDQFIIVVTFFMMASIMAFLIFNWYPASIFMGDSGSLIIGFVISVVAIRATTYISDTAILFIAAVPIIDTIIVMTRRIQRGISPFAPDKTHFHHKLVNLKGSTDGSVHILLSLQIILSSIGILLRDKSDFINLMLFIIILFVFFQALDSRREQRTTLFISKIKMLYLDKLKALTHCRTMYATIFVLVLLLLLKLF
jgi:UDP-GlcNAc:undecaprenyl-phosphate GlcNAc-1-phosphate transferase